MEMCFFPHSFCISMSYLDVTGGKQTLWLFFIHFQLHYVTTCTQTILFSNCKAKSMNTVNS